MTFVSTLKGSGSKLRRAQTHLRALDRRIQGVRRSNLKRVARELNDEVGEKAFIYRGNPRQLHPSISLIVGDAIHNWRSALDHLAWSLVEANGNTPTRGTAFPIIDDPARYKRSFKRQTKGMSGEATTMLTKEQPCCGPRSLRKGYLALLAELDNVDKHRHLYVTITATDGGLFSEPLPLDIFTQGFIHSGPIHDGTLLAQTPKGHHHLEFTPAFDIAFGPGMPAEGKSVRGALGFIDYIVGDILNQFDQAFFG